MKSGSNEGDDDRVAVYAELRPIPSVWGHRAGNPSVSAADFSFLKSAVRDWMDR